jgi:hypothetical protein
MAAKSRDIGTLPHHGMPMEGDDSMLAMVSGIRVSSLDRTTFSADPALREEARFEDPEAPDIIDGDEVASLGRLVYFWARSYGLLERSDRVQRHVILHATRLITALDPSMSRKDREVVLKVVTWLIHVERGNEGPELMALLVGDGRGTRRVEHAAVDLRTELRALGLDPAELIRSFGPAEDGASVLDRTAQWVYHLLRAWTGVAHTPWFDVELVLPSQWVSDVNPCAFDVEADIEAWLRGIGVIKDEETYRVFQELTVAEYVGWPCPLASYDQLWTVMGFLSLWIFHDDNLEGVGARSPEILARAISGRLVLEEPALSNRYLRGWAELGWRFSRVMSPRWLQRHYDRFLEWVNAVGVEARILREYRQENRVPETAEYFQLRRKTIGTYPTANFLEYFIGVELPEDITGSARFGSILDTLADIVSIHNDLFGFSTDTKRRMLNLVSSRVAEGASYPRAFVELAKLHNDKLQMLAEETLALVSEADESVRNVVANWVEGIRYIVSGFVQWHALTSRYSDVHRLPDGSIVRVMVSIDPSDELVSSVQGARDRSPGHAVSARTGYRCSAPPMP